MNVIGKMLVKLLKGSRNLSALACHLTKLTGKSKYSLHPKHLINLEEPWYLRDINKKEFVLDLGCGNGQQTIVVAKECKKVIGIDNNLTNLAIAKQLVKDKKIKNAEFIKTDLEKKLFFKNESFDKILALDVLEHLRKRKQFLKEIKRVLKPEGLIYLSVPNKNTSWKKRQKKVGLNYYTDPDHKIEYSLSGIRKILLQTGFQILSIKPIVLDTPWLGFIDLVGGFSLSFYKKLSLWKKKKVKNDLQESIGFRIIVSK